MVDNRQIMDFQKYVPTDNRNLAACPWCKIIMTEQQWNKINTRCPNCHKSVEPTQDYVGMISIMMPKESWVAKWNEIRENIPGVYAINVPQFLDEEIAAENATRGAKNLRGLRDTVEDDLDGFIASDNEY